MRTMHLRLVVTGLLAGLLVLSYTAEMKASGPVGLYAVVERVVFEPNEQAAERVQIWGAFAFVDGGIQSARATTAPQRGYLYFALPAQPSEAQTKAIRKEWSDLKSVAGTGQAVAFGNWRYMGLFSEVENNGVPVPGQSGSRPDSLRVQKEAQTRMDPTPYTTNTGIVKLAGTGSHAAVVDQLRALLKK